MSSVLLVALALAWLLVVLLAWRAWRVSDGRRRYARRLAVNRARILRALDGWEV